MDISIKHLTKIYKPNIYALKGCHLDIASGEFLVVMGPSGCGKSTLLKVLAGIENSTAGEIYFAGVTTRNIPLHERSIALVFQEYVLYPNKTVFENVLAGVKYKGVPIDIAEQRAVYALQMFDLYDARDQLPKHLSGGQQQRTALAKAFVSQSKLVLMDEPMSNVAEETRKVYCKYLSRLKEEMPDSTFVYVTHNIAEALALGDRVAFMDDGKILGCIKKNMLKREVLSNDPSILLNKPLHKNTFTLPCQLTDSALVVNGERVPLDTISSRLMALPKDAQAQFSIDKLSKTPLSQGIPLVFQVVENKGDYLLLSIGDQTICLPRKTNLADGVRIRMYYDVKDICLLCEGKRILANHSLGGNLFPIKVISAQQGRFALFGKKYSVAAQIPQNCSKIFIPFDAITLAKGGESCVVRAFKCLQEDYFEDFIIGYYSVAGLDSYVSAKLPSDGCYLVDKKPSLALDLSKMLFV